MGAFEYHGAALEMLPSTSAAVEGLVEFPPPPEPPRRGGKSLLARLRRH